MDKTFLHSKLCISQFIPFLMKHFFQMTVFEGSKLNWKRKFFIKKCIFYFHTCNFLSCYPSHCLCIDILCIVQLYGKHFTSLCSAPCFILIYLSVLHLIWHTLCPVQSYATFVLQAKTGNSWNYEKGGVCWGLSASLFLFLGISNA